MIKLFTFRPKHITRPSPSLRFLRRAVCWRQKCITRAVSAYKFWCQVKVKCHVTFVRQLNFTTDFDKIWSFNVKLIWNKVHQILCRYLHRFWSYWENPGGGQILPPSAAGRGLWASRLNNLWTRSERTAPILGHRYQNSEICFFIDTAACINRWKFQDERKVQSV